jgi:uncharacterized protein (TIGR03000 family)
MLRRFVPFLGTAALSLAAISVVAEPAAAQRQGRGEGSSQGRRESSSQGRRSSYGNSRWYGDRGGYNSGRYWYGANYGLGLTIGGYSPYYSQVYGPQYAPGTYGYDANYYGSDTSAGRSFMYQPGDANIVNISVRVSPDAEIWFDGTKTTQKGSLRRFTSPRIDADGEHTYAIRALWTEGGREVDQTRNVSFHAGDRLTVNFTTAQTKSTELSEKRTDAISTSRETPVLPVVREEEPRQPRTPEAKDADKNTRDEATRQQRVPVTKDADKNTREGEPGQPRLQEAKDAVKSTHDGKVVSITADKLVMTGKDDSEHSHALTADAKLTCDGKVCKCEDIKAGMKIRVTTKQDDKQTVTRIESLSKNDNFENRD